MEYSKRKDVPVEYTWDLTDYFKDFKQWEKEYKIQKKQIGNITKYNGKLLESAETLYDALEEYYKLDTKLTKLYVYAYLKEQEDLQDKLNASYFSKIYNLYCEFLVLSSFIVPEILAAKNEKVQKLLKNKKLQKYKFIIQDILRKQEHGLSKNEELLVTKLNSPMDAFEKVSSILSESLLDYGSLDVDGEKTTITTNNFRTIMTNKNRKTRKECYNLFASKLKEYNMVFSELLLANMKNVSNNASIKKFNSTLEMQLFSSNIPKEVVTTLYNVVHKRLDAYGKYFDLLKANIGLEELEYYDLQTEFLPETISFSVEDAQLLITKATQIYDQEFSNIIQKAFTDRWCDYAAYKGKCSGAFAISSYPDAPKVLTNFQGKFSDVSAIAHELGHAVNFYLSEANNGAHDYQNDIFTAEVASLTNEIILSYYIIENGNNKNLKLTAIYNLIDIIQNNLFDACLEGELENKIYKLLDTGKDVSGEALGDCIYDLRALYYQRKVKLDDNIKYMWAKRKHYYMPFYLFEYATGVSAAIMIATRIIDGDMEMKKNYIKFLKRGSSDYPINLLKELGVDMTKSKVYNNAIDFFEYLIDKFNKVSEE